jgi:uncharacterized Zn-finger protein
MPNFETVHVDTTVVACDGGGGAGGHPKVYLNLAGSGEVECPYCSRLFTLRKAGSEPGAAAPPPQP